MENSVGFVASKNIVPDGYDYRKFSNLVDAILKNKIMEEDEKENWLKLVTVMDVDDTETFNWMLRRQIVEYNDYKDFDEFLKSPIREQMKTTRDKFKSIIN